VTAANCPGLDAVRCEHCGAWIVRTDYGWGDWDAPTLVFCEFENDPLPTTRHRPPVEAQRLDGCTCSPIAGAHRPPCPWAMHS
jgi:hypothetical protein